MHFLQIGLILIISISTLITNCFKICHLDEDGCIDNIRVLLDLPEDKIYINIIKEMNYIEIINVF